MKTLIYFKVEFAIEHQLKIDGDFIRRLQNSIPMIIYANSRDYSNRAISKSNNSDKRRKRSTGSSNASGSANSSGSGVKVNRKYRKHRKPHYGRVREQGLCRRTGLYVDFGQLNWQEWILAPGK